MPAHLPRSHLPVTLTSPSSPSPLLTRPRSRQGGTHGGCLRWGAAGRPESALTPNPRHVRGQRIEEGGTRRMGWARLL